MNSAAMILLASTVFLANPASETSSALAAMQQSPRAEAAATETKRVRGYSLVLLLGDTQGSAFPKDLSAPARKALTDVRDFLPFKSYQILDTQWLAGSDFGASTSGRLRGPGQEEYLLFSLDVSQLNQKFALWSADRRTKLFETGFTMKVGETVVVGTSRIPGDKALVVLLTIVPLD